MHEIFELQRKLNITIYGNIGIDFEATLTDPELTVTWIENCRKALSAELAELIREVQEFGMGSQNGRVEVVDLLHFLVSLSFLVGIGPEEASVDGDGAEPGEFCEAAMEGFLALDALQNSLKWKWWAKGGGFKPEKARAAVEDFWGCFGRYCALFGMDFEAVKRLYTAKNRLNFQRQEQHYNEDTKTEADNQALEP